MGRGPAAVDREGGFEVARVPPAASPASGSKGISQRRLVRLRTPREVVEIVPDLWS